MKEKAMRVKGELCMLYGKPVFFTEERINANDLPDDLYKYDISHNDDDDRILETLEKFVYVNRFGTVISKEPIDLGTEDERRLQDDDFEYGIYPLSLYEFSELSDAEIKEIQNSDIEYLHLV